MNRWPKVVLIAAVVMAVGLPLVLVARRHHTPARTPTAAKAPADLSDRLRQDCPSGPPDGCRELIARLLRVQVHTLARFPATVDRLSFRQGYVLFRSGLLNSAVATRQPMFAVLEYANSSEPGTTFDIRITRLANDFSQKMDPRPIR